MKIKCLSASYRYKKWFTPGATYFIIGDNLTDNQGEVWGFCGIDLFGTIEQVNNFFDGHVIFEEVRIL